MTWDPTKDPPPEPYTYHEPTGPFAYLGRPARWMTIPPKPPVEQTSLFPTLEDEISDQIEKLQKKYKFKKTRIKHICRLHKVEEKEARKAYKKAFERLEKKLLYDNYQRNRDYIQWFYSPAGRQYTKNYMAWIDARKKREDEDFKRRLDEGTEHVVSITSQDPELLSVLDNPIWANMICSSPITFLLKTLTENDARILKAKGYLELVLGDEETLFNHKFATRQEIEQRQRESRDNRAKCRECGKEMSYNDIGFATKMGQPGLCSDCIGAEPEFIESVTERYRSSGCNMFI